MGRRSSGPRGLPAILVAVFLSSAICFANNIPPVEYFDGVEPAFTFYADEKLPAGLHPHFADDEVTDEVTNEVSDDEIGNLLKRDRYNPEIWESDECLDPDGQPESNMAWNKLGNFVKADNRRCRGILGLRKGRCDPWMDLLKNKCTAFCQTSGFWFYGEPIQYMGGNICQANETCEISRKEVKEIMIENKEMESKTHTATVNIGLKEEIKVEAKLAPGMPKTVKRIGHKLNPFNWGKKKGAAPTQVQVRPPSYQLNFPTGDDFRSGLLIPLENDLGDGGLAAVEQTSGPNRAPSPPNPQKPKDKGEKKFQFSFGGPPQLGTSENDRRLSGIRGADDETRGKAGQGPVILAHPEEPDSTVELLPVGEDPEDWGVGIRGRSAVSVEQEGDVGSTKQQKRSPDDVGTQTDSEVTTAGSDKTEAGTPPLSLTGAGTLTASVEATFGWTRSWSKTHTHRTRRATITNITRRKPMPGCGMFVAIPKLVAYCGWIAEPKWPKEFQSQIMGAIEAKKRLNEIRKGKFSNGQWGSTSWAVTKRGCPVDNNHRPFCKAFALTARDTEQSNFVWEWLAYDCDTRLPIPAKWQSKAVRESMHWDTFLWDHIMHGDPSTSEFFGYGFAYNQNFKNSRT